MNTNADISLVKLANYRCVWNYLHSHREITIPQIAKATGLSIPTVTRTIEYSLNEGVVHSVGIVGGERGRKANLYSLAPNYMHFIFISIHGRKLYFEIHDFLSCVLEKGSILLTDKNILSVMTGFIKESLNKDSLIKFVNIAFSGTVFEGKIVDSFDFPSLIDFDLKSYLEEKFPIIVTVENDLHAAVSAFSKYSPLSEEGIVVALYFGDDGLGSGIIVNGELLRGSRGSAGELLNVVSTDKSKRTNETYAEVLRSLTAILDPNKVVLYPNGTADAEKVKTLAFEGGFEFMKPSFVDNRNFTKDTFIGLVALCKANLIEPYAKVRLLKQKIY